MSGKLKHQVVKRSNTPKCAREPQRILVDCKGCGQQKVRTMRPGGKPFYCDDCNDSTIRARKRKQEQRTAPF